MLKVGFVGTLINFRLENVQTGSVGIADLLQRGDADSSPYIQKFTVSDYVLIKVISEALKTITDPVIYCTGTVHVHNRELIGSIDDVLKIMNPHEAGVLSGNGDDRSSIDSSGADGIANDRNEQFIE